MNQQLTSIRIDARINTIHLNGRVRAFASITLADCFVVRGVKVIETPTGLFAAMPSRRSTSGEYRDTCFPIVKELREQINEVVLEAYRQALLQAGEQTLQVEESEEGGFPHE
ncbi:MULTISPECIES: SpoVG family protein [Clostridia]|uniref:SpoVG family protein n=1 Tax=Clostridia TaxID=186801 RepID=UPI0024BD3734|nr:MULTISPECIES: SpoVG family protein [Eubacteriales]WRR94042.1 SpoVG family protein [Sinanaerobacter sp. ZZT-01]